MGMNFVLLKAASNGYPTKHKTDGSTHACSSILSFFSFEKEEIWRNKGRPQFSKKNKTNLFLLETATNGKYM